MVVHLSFNMSDHWELSASPHTIYSTLDVSDMEVLVVYQVKIFLPVV